jgi:DNA processing protein
MSLVAVVGTREPTAEQRIWASAFGAALSRNGLGVCSGFAPGIDRAAHRGCLAAGGTTVATLGECPGDIRSRGESEGLGPLADAVCHEGCFVSELAPGNRARDRRTAVYRLLARNRLIAALSRAVVVVAAHEKGGAHVTARWASRIGIPVFAVDFGPATPIGNLKLLLSGAQPLPGEPRSAADAIAATRIA